MQFPNRCPLHNTRPSGLVVPIFGTKSPNCKPFEFFLIKVRNADKSCSSERAVGVKPAASKTFTNSAFQLFITRVVSPNIVLNRRETISVPCAIPFSCTLSVKTAGFSLFSLFFANSASLNWSIFSLHFIPFICLFYMYFLFLQV